MSAVCKYSYCRRLFQSAFNNSINLNHVTKCWSSSLSKAGGSPRKIMLIALGTACAVPIAGVAIANSGSKPELEFPEQPTEIPFTHFTELPSVKLSRKVVNPKDDSNLKLVLFQYPTCPFCCKVRAFLDYNGIPYDVVEVDPVLRQQTSWSEYKKVPIVVAKAGEVYYQLNDSSMIISLLHSYLNDKKQTINKLLEYYPVIKFMDEDQKYKLDILNKYYLMYLERVPKNLTSTIIAEERKWRRWADDSLVHALSPNVYRTPSEALQAFQWFSEVGEWNKLFPFWERYLIVYGGALAMWLVGKRLKKRHHIKDEVRQSLYDECHTWMKAIKKKGTPFMGGSEPNLADLAVYGVLSSIEGCLAFNDLLENTNIGVWYTPMKTLIENNKGTVQVV